MRVLQVLCACVYACACVHGGLRVCMCKYVCEQARAFECMKVEARGQPLDVFLRYLYLIF